MKMPDNLKNVSLSQVLGVSALLIGVGWIVGIFFNSIDEFDDEPFYIALLIFVGSIFSSIPGFFSSYYGYKLLKSTEKKYIKGVVGSLIFITLFLIPLYTIPGCFAVFFVFNLIRTKERKFFKLALAWMLVFVVILAWDMVLRFLGDAYDGSIFGDLYIVIAVSVLFPTYVYLSMLVMKQDSLGPVEFKDFIGKGIVFLYAFFLFGFVDSLLEGVEYTGPDTITTPNYLFKTTASSFVEAFVILAPLVAAWLFYRFVMKKVDKLHAEEVILET